MITFSDYSTIQSRYLRNAPAKETLDKVKKILKNELVSRISSFVCGTAISAGIFVHHFLSGIDQLIASAITFDAKHLKHAGQYLFLALSQPVVLEGLAIMGIFVPRKAEKLASEVEVGNWERYAPGHTVETSALQAKVLSVFRGVLVGAILEFQTPSKLIMACFKADTLISLRDTWMNIIGLPIGIYAGICGIFDERTRETDFDIKTRKTVEYETVEHELV